MSSSRKALATLLLAAFALPALAQDKFPGIGRAATPKEVAAWDIDVRPDFKGLPPGSGSVAAGQDIWESKCASCHGFFAESNSVFTPLVGGTTAEDVKTGRVANLTRTDFSNAFLYGVDFGSATGNTKVNGTTFSGAVLVGANFKGAAFGIDSSQGGQATTLDGA